MDLPRFKKGGGITLNGPSTSGYAVKTRVYLGPGVVMGADVLIVTTDRNLSEAIAAYLNDQVVSRPTHVLLGQPPWFHNETREFDLDDLLGDAPAQQGPTPRPALDTWAALAPRPRKGLLDV